MRGSSLGRMSLVGAILALVCVGTSLMNHGFASVENARDVLVNASPVLIVGCGMTLLVLAGEIDVSAGSLMGLLAAVIGIASSETRWGLSAPATAAITIGVGGGVGLVNGLLVTKGRVPSIIATLGMLTILRGWTEMLMGDVWITDLPEGVRALGTGVWLGVPVCLWVAAVCVAACAWLAQCGVFGLRIYAVGGNEQAAGLARVPVARVKLQAFVLVGMLTGVAALVTVPQQSVIEAGIGRGFEMVVITAVVVGGTSIRGGYGGIGGMVLAAVLLASIRTALVFLNLGESATFWERAIQGAFVLGAVLSDHIGGRGRSSGEPAA